MGNTWAQIPRALLCHISIQMTGDLCVHVSNPLIKSHYFCLSHIITFWPTKNTLLSNSKFTSDTFLGPQTGQRIALQLQQVGLLLWKGLTRWIENIIGECGL